MLPEMLEPAACVKTTLQHFSSLTSLTSFPHTPCACKEQGCNIQIFYTAPSLRSSSFVFFPPVNKADVGGGGGVLNLTSVVIFNLKGVYYMIPTANTIKHVCV